VHRSALSTPATLFQRVTGTERKAERMTPRRRKAESLRYWLAATTQMISAVALLIRTIKVR